MWDEMRITSVITARAGSKGLPRKNTRLLAGKPLIAWTIEHARASKYINDTIVSTDDKEIARIAESLGAQVPFLRPEELAQDDTPTIDVVVHLLGRMKEANDHLPEYVALLQPTSPLRTSADIDTAVEMLVSDKRANAVVSITEVSENPYWMKTLTSEGFIDDFVNHGEDYHRRQDMPAVYKLNGAIYVCRTPVLLESRSFCPENTFGYVMPKERSIDIDTILDFKLAELMISKR